MKILIVEDEEILRKVLQEKFTKENFSVKTAKDGGAVMALVKSFKPDLILLDIVLPKKDGLTVLQELRDNAEFSTIPVIMTSNLGEDEKIKLALKLGAVDYLVKTQHSVSEIIDQAKKYLLKAK
jgi:DNA-binding response OmpR family regulator